MHHSDIDTFLGFLRGEQRPDAGNTGFLAAFCQRYPYCQPAQVFLALSLLRSGENTGSREYKKAMTYVPDKLKFQQLMLDYQDALPETNIWHSRLTGTSPSLSRQSKQSEDPDSPGPDTDNGQPETVNRLRQQDIIDRFLRENPRITPKRGDTFEPSDPGTGLEEDHDLVSETLAEILLKQGKKDKAVGIYKKLCLKYPEKSSYFAKKIEDVENRS